MRTAPLLLTSLLLLTAAALTARAEPTATLDAKVLAGLRAPAFVPLGPGVQVGFRYEQASGMGPGLPKLRQWLAVVGETEDAWRSSAA